jgi:sirohydrochlorin ferrochelatase
MSQTIKGLLLIAHGSRNPEANEDLVLLGRQMEGGEFPVVEPSYLELAQPSIEDGAKKCISRGATDITMVPYFLSAGVHVKTDLQEALENLGKEYPHARFKLTAHLGRHPLLLEIVKQRIAEAGQL